MAKVTELELKNIIGQEINNSMGYMGGNLSALAYKNEKQVVDGAKKLGFPWAKLISRDGAEVLVAKDRNDLWFAFRGTEPSKLNDVMADLNVIKNSATAGGKVHSGFQKEVNDLWLDIQQN